MSGCIVAVLFMFGIVISILMRNDLLFKLCLVLSVIFFISMMGFNYKSFSTASEAYRYNIEIDYPINNKNRFVMFEVEKVNYRLGLYKKLNKSWFFDPFISDIVDYVDLVEVEYEP